MGAIATQGAGLFACAIGNLFIAAAAASYGEGRELEYHEAVEVIAACFLPGIGLAIVHRYFFDHPEFDQIVKDPSIYPRYTYEYQQRLH